MRKYKGFKRYKNDFAYLRKNLNLKKFIKTLEPQDFDNQKQISSPTFGFPSTIKYASKNL